MPIRCYNSSSARRGRLAKGFSLDQAAKALATSKRTLARRMQSVLGKSPLAFFQDLRIELAVVGRGDSDCATSFCSDQAQVNHL